MEEYLKERKSRFNELKIKGLEEQIKEREKNDQFRRYWYKRKLNTRFL